MLLTSTIRRLRNHIRFLRQQVELLYKGVCWFGRIYKSSIIYFPIALYLKNYHALNTKKLLITAVMMAKFPAPIKTVLIKFNARPRYHLLFVKLFSSKCSPMDVKQQAIRQLDGKKHSVLLTGKTC